MSEQSTKLAQEMETYRKHLPGWGSREGQFVLIRDSEICDFFEEYTEALTEGYKRFGIIPFLVKKVMQQQQTHSVTRLVAPQSVR